MGLTALTAASFCVFLTPETATFFGWLTGARRCEVFAGVFLVALATFLAATFFAGLALVLALTLRGTAFTPLTRFALGLEELAFTACLAVFADARFVVERAVDRRKPFVRLLLMCGFSKGCSAVESSRRMARSLP
jgi:hypothetical protein